MERAEILSRISQLNPDNFPISQALSFLRVVVKNNPNKTAAEIAARADVKEARKVILDWTDEVKKVMDESFQLLPKLAAKGFVNSIYPTINGFREEISLTEGRLASWRRETFSDVAIAKIVLRMNWALEWIANQVNSLTMDAPFKRWVCRMAPTSCSFCKALNGVTIPRSASFAKYARKAGWKRMYGGLYAPGLHPNCQCHLEPATRAEYDTYKEALSSKGK